MSMMLPTRADWPSFRELENRLNRMFGSWPWEPEQAGVAWSPAVDLHESDDAYTLEADLPGLTKNDIHLSIADDVVTLKGERSQKSEKKAEGYHRVERIYGSFQRSFRIPGGIDASKVEANFEHGVLKVTLPKPEERKPRQIDVKVQER
ncbi:MAG: Hsp20/alpha crystallin family protein [Candidatus Hydrogenedentes bacterium]|nr:Hsp20/alpha crystallin family protein [Candidatus Hydrogenedentota bacterium]MBI3119101.1 Hsp20/alpha crystallin family protein [Candidatus Hydrogenedentota bacterium]